MRNVDAVLNRDSELQHYNRFSFARVDDHIRTLRGDGDFHGKFEFSIDVEKEVPVICLEENGLTG